jgi:hypothetical protein
LKCEQRSDNRVSLNMSYIRGLILFAKVSIVAVDKVNGAKVFFLQALPALSLVASW